MSKQEYLSGFSKMHLIRKATPITNSILRDLNLDDDMEWLEKSRRLQARRWRHIKNQLD